MQNKNLFNTTLRFLVTSSSPSQKLALSVNSGDDVIEKIAAASGGAPVNSF